MVINESTLRVDIFYTVYNVLNLNVSDPESRSKQWIFTNVPNTTASNFIGYPIMKVNKVRPSKDYDLFDNAYSDKTVPIVITVYATNNVLLETLTDSVDAVMVPSNFPQFTFNEYTESGGETDLGAGTVYFTTMTYSIDIGWLS